VDARCGGGNPAGLPGTGNWLCGLQALGPRLPQCEIQEVRGPAAWRWRRNSPRFQEDNFVRNRELVERIESLAMRKKCTAAQLALGWLLAQGGDIVPIPATKRRKYPCLCC